MPAENISLSLLSSISLISFFVFLLISKYSNKIGNGILLDQDFNKPQAFHSLSIPRSGGLAASLSFFAFVLKSVSYQPPPFKRKPAAETFLTRDLSPQLGHFTNGFSLIFCNSSNSCPQDLHAYS